MTMITLDVVAVRAVGEVSFIKFPITKYSRNTPEVALDDMDECKEDAVAHVITIKNALGGRLSINVQGCSCM